MLITEERALGATLTGFLDIMTLGRENFDTLSQIGPPVE
jgi:hypothetical protein